MYRSIRRPVRSFALAVACGSGVLALPLANPAMAAAQTPAAPRESGTVKAVHERDLVLTTAGGEYTVTVPEAARVLIVPPGSTSLSSAAPGTLGDIQPGDRALITGSAGDVGTSLNATRVVLMKSNAIAAVHAAESSAWAQGVGGIVRSVSASAVTISSGMRTVAVETTPSTIVRRYAPGSVKFADATTSTVAAIQPGDQLRVRGSKVGDGAEIKADEIVTGNFKNYSGTLQAIDPATGTVTLKDLTSKREVTVAVTPNSDLRRLPPEMAAAISARMRGGAGATGTASGASSVAAPGTAAGAGAAAGAGQGGRRAGSDLSALLTRMPAETLGGLKPGDAVMIVATAPSAAAGEKATAITLLTGVEAVLAAPAGESTTLSPWSVGGGEPEAPGASPGGPGAGGQ